MDEKEYLERKQKKAFEALRQLDDVFTKNNIQYYLLAGSVLGAVRNKGFIPWDDDIDVGIMYSDMEKARSILSSELKDGFYYLDRWIDNRYPRLYGKILYEKEGCVDIFLLVDTSDNRFEQKKQWIKRKVWFKLYKAKIGYSNENENKTIFGKSIVVLFRIISVFFSKEKIEKNIKNVETMFQNQKESPFVVNLYSAYSLEKELIEKKWLTQPGLVEFNGTLFPTVNDTDRYLKNLYGDYLKLPPVEKRHPGHIERFL